MHFLYASQLSAAQDIARRVKELKAAFPLDWTTIDSDETRAYIDYVRLFQYTESIEILLPSLKASFARSDDGNELVPITGLDGPSLHAYSDQLRELQICRDDLLAHRSMNNGPQTSEVEVAAAPTPMRQQTSSDQAASSPSRNPMPQQQQPPPTASTNAATVARKRRLGFPSNLENSTNTKLQPGGGAITFTSSSTSADTVAADILDLTGQLKASAGEVNSTLKAQTAILEKTGEEAMQNIERVKRETDKVGIRLGVKRRNMFATFSAMAMALASFIVVYLLIIMPFGKKRAFSSYIAPLLFRWHRGGGTLPTADDDHHHHDLFMKDGGNSVVDGPPMTSVVVVDETGEDDKLDLKDFINFNCSEGGGGGGSSADACDEEDHAEVPLQRNRSTANIESVVIDVDVDGGVQRFVNKDVETKENNGDKSAEVEGRRILDDMQHEDVTKEPNTSEISEEGGEEDMSEEILPNATIVVEETKNKRNDRLMNLGDDDPNVSQEAINIPRDEGDDDVVVVIAQGAAAPQHTIENDKILFDSNSSGKGKGVSGEEEEEVVKIIDDVHLEGGSTIAPATNQSSDRMGVDVVSHVENTIKKNSPIGKDKDDEGVGKSQFQAAAFGGPNGVVVPAADLELETTVELESNENKIHANTKQDDAAPRTAKGGRKEEVGVLSSPEEDEHGDNDKAMKNPNISQEKKETNDEFLQQRFKLERSKLQVLFFISLSMSGCTLCI